jgi:ssDNA-binding Zn-finger/Zn-ribbon topoisomerase 1
MGDYDNRCPVCGKKLKAKSGKYGSFLGCSGFPKCRHTESMPKQSAPAISDESIAWVNASDIGQVNFCAHSFQLRKKGVQQNIRSQAKMHVGKLHHATANYNATTRDRRCFIASYALGPDHPITESFRQYRDNVLKKTWPGRIFIQIYYAISPILIGVFGRFRWFKLISVSVVKYLHNKMR